MCIVTPDRRGRGVGTQRGTAKGTTAGVPRQDPLGTPQDKAPANSRGAPGSSACLDHDARSAVQHNPIRYALAASRALAELGDVAATLGPAGGFHGTQSATALRGSRSFTIADCPCAGSRHSPSPGHGRCEVRSPEGQGTLGPLCYSRAATTRIGERTWGWLAVDGGGAAKGPALWLCGAEQSCTAVQRGSGRCLGVGESRQTHFAVSCVFGVQSSRGLYSRIARDSFQRCPSAPCNGWTHQPPVSRRLPKNPSTQKSTTHSENTLSNAMQTFQLPPTPCNRYGKVPN